MTNDELTDQTIIELKLIDDAGRDAQRTRNESIKIADDVYALTYASLVEERMRVLLDHTYHAVRLAMK